MLTFITKLLIKEIISAVANAIADYFALKKKRKEDKVLVDDVIKEKDPQKRATRMRDILS